MAAQKTDAQKPDTATVRLSVRTRRSVARRFRAGLGPFGPAAHVLLDATPDQARALRDDPELEVQEL